MQSAGGRIIRPNEVKTLDDYARREPDRYFYILFGDDVWECDGYMIKDDGKELWTILIRCPVCNQNLKLDSEKKSLRIDDKGLELKDTIQCSWPGQFGGLCNFHVAVEPPRKFEDRMVRVAGRQLKIDAVARRV